MRKLVQSCILPVILFILAYNFSACRKASDTNTPQQDTLEQHVYTISRDNLNNQGYIVLAPYNINNTLDSGTLMIMNGAGQVLKQKKTATGVLNFKRWTINGNTRYTWYNYDPSKNVINSLVNILSGYIVIADENLNEISRVSLLPSGKVTVTKNEGLDGHDFILLGDNHYIAMAYYEMNVSNIPTSISGGASVVTTPVIQEVQDGQVIWQWIGADYPEFYATSVEGNNYSKDPEDYMHMNSMIVDSSDNNLICSFRNMDQILKINRTTGDIIWRLGGSNSDFPLTADQQFLRQHHATLTDNGNTLMVFDNGEINLRPYSRILEFQLDQKNKTVMGFRSFKIPEPFTQFTGSVQKFGDHYFICGGTAEYVLDINYMTGAKSLEMLGNQLSYRAFRY